MNVPANPSFPSRLLLLTTLLLAACGDSDGQGFQGPPDDTTPVNPDLPEDQNTARFGRIDEVLMRARPVAGGIEVRVPVEWTSAPQAVRLRLTLRDLAGGEVSAFDASVNPGADGALVVVLPGSPSFEVPAGTAEAGVLGGYVLSYRLESGSDSAGGRRSLWQMWTRYDVTLLSAESLNVDGATTTRVLARDAATGQPLAGVPVTLRLTSVDGTRDIAAGTTDAEGMFVAPVDAEEAEVGEGSLVAALQVGTDSTESLEVPVRVLREQRVMVTTDKPMYQPGQQIHVRTLSLSRPSLRPAAERPVTIELADAAGNMVYRYNDTTDAYGVAALTIPLAERLNEGNWTISATVDGVTTERTVLVQRYQLPDFGMTILPDRGYYRPGDTATVALDARYFFGRPVSGASVVVEAYTFDVGFNLYNTASVTLNDEGLGQVEVPIPEFLVGQELNGGSAFVRLDFVVTDAAGQTEELTRNLVVSSQDLGVSVVAGAPALSGTELPLYVLTRTPDGRAAEATGTVRTGTDEIEFSTDATGFAEVLVPVGESGVGTLQVTAVTESGDEGTAELVPETAAAEDVVVFAAQAVHTAGDSAEFEFVARGAASRLFVDVVRDGQTLLTDVVDLQEGRASYTLDLSPDLAGAVVVQGWFVTADGRIVRGGRTIYVDSPNDLRIDWQTDREEYRPGDTATLDLTVTDPDGNGVQAAVGLTVVDEAVFALQDNQPGFERVFFQLEEALLNPAYNIYGFSIRDVVAGGEYTEQERERAATVVLSQVESAGGGSAVNTLQVAGPQALSSSQQLAQPVLELVLTTVNDRLRRQNLTWQQWNDLQADAAAFAEVVGSPNIVDPWGRRLQITVEPADWNSRIRAVSRGMDELESTADDIVRTFDSWQLDPGIDWNSEDDFAGGGGGGGGFADAGMEPNPDNGGEPEEEGGGGSSGPRVRQYFPETLWVQPDIITDPQGRHSMEIPLADSITTWRMTGIASSAAGQLGSSTGGIRVFQPFFVDIDVPLALTQGDSVEMPVAVFNYLETAQTVDIELDVAASGDWFTPNGPTTRTLTLEPGEITSTSFGITVNEVGVHPLQVIALGTEESDAVRRVVRVLPDGQAQPISVSDSLSATTTRTVTIPTAAIDNASSLVVKIYPGLFGQVIEGLDSLFQMPSGCFEQTSSTTYPNILALRYLRDTDQLSPEIELTATQYIAQGYQALVSYEVPGGGFEWFGQTPAHRILTAYGLLEFSDMAEVFDIDEALIPRTQVWLVSQQEADGRFRASPEGIHEGATNSFQDSDLRASAYVTYALAESGYTGTALDRAFAWLDANRATSTDAYTDALIANAYLAADRNSATARTVLQRLLDSRQSIEEDGQTRYFWSSASQSLYYGEGDAMNMEVTALALQAFIRARFSPETVDGGIAWLVSRKDSFGNWSSTQATILSLRAFIELMENSTPELDADVAVYVGDELVGTVSVDASNSDIFHQIDVSNWLQEGDNEITLELTGSEGLYYALAGEYWLPWGDVEPTPADSPMSVTVEYDRTTLAVDEQVTVTATVQNTTDARLDMVMLELGVPPGFDVVMGDFDAALEDPTSGLARVERIGRRVVLYLYGLDPEETVSFVYRLQATLVVEVQTPATVAYLYYDSSQRAESAPVQVVVTE